MADALEMDEHGYPTEAAEAEHLLLCPFCGGESLSIQNLVNDDDYFVSCDTCEVQQIANYTRADAIERWNRRVK